jgi:hypothetical protein
MVGRGVRIVHTRPDYPAKIIFWAFRDPDRVVNDIRVSGFLPRASSAAVPSRRGFPFQGTPLVALVVVWNILVLLDGFVPWKEPKGPGLFVQLAFALVFLAAALTQRSKTVQHWVLQPGRSIGEIRPFLLLLQVVSGFLLVASMLFGLLEAAAT